MKQRIPKALREQVWLKTNKQNFKVKCPISWCNNEISVFDFHVGHIIPESRGGLTTINNLMPICAKCNLSMSNNYTITHFSNAFTEQKTTYSSELTQIVTCSEYLDAVALIRLIKSCVQKSECVGFLSNIWPP